MEEFQLNYYRTTSSVKAYYVMHTQKSDYFLLAKFTAEDLELLRLFEIESAANYLQRIEEEKRTGTEERVRRTSER